MQEAVHQFPRGLYIGNTWRSAISGEAFPVLNPATGESLGEVPSGGPEECNEAIAEAATAFGPWSELSGRQRSHYLHRAYQLLRKHRQELAWLVTLEEGKPWAEAEAEVVSAAAFVGWYAEEAKRINGTVVESYDARRRVWVTAQPLGVVVAVTPWNFPADMVTKKVAPALAAGCTVVLKPSEKAPLAAMAIVELFRQAGLPKGVLNLIVGNPTLLGETIFDNPLVRKVTLTGSTQTGKWFTERSGRHLIRLALELGGTAPYIVCQDAQLDAAVTGITLAKYRNAGQVCAAPNAVFVHDSVYASYIAQLRAAALDVTVGPGWSSTTTMGPLINEVALERVQGLVDEAVLDGGKVLTGGTPLTLESWRRGQYYPPTLISDCDSTMRVVQEEIFGPVIPIVPYEDEDALVMKLNRMRGGLGAYVWTENLRRAFKMAESLDCGIVGVNDPLPAAIESPFGGRKESGMGREGGLWGLNEFMDLKTISLKL